LASPVKVHDVAVVLTGAPQAVAADVFNRTS